MPSLKGRIRKEADGHRHPVYGTLKAGTVVDVEMVSCNDKETGQPRLFFPGQVFEPVGWTVPKGTDGDDWYLTPEFVEANAPAAQPSAVPAVQAIPVPLTEPAAQAAPTPADAAPSPASGEGKAEGNTKEGGETR